MRKVHPKGLEVRLVFLRILHLNNKPSTINESDYNPNEVVINVPGCTQDAPYFFYSHCLI